VPWHDARGLLDPLGREALFEPEASLESGNTKRRPRNLIDASGLLGELIAIAPRAARDEELRSLHTWDYMDRVRADSADRGGDAGGWSPFGRWTHEIAALAAGGCLAAVDAVLDQTVVNAYALVRPPGHHAGPAGAAATACSPTWLWPRCTATSARPGPAWPSSIGTSIRATAHRPRSGRTRAC
jgi:Histone deacetylase domain